MKSVLRESPSCAAARTAPCCRPLVSRESPQHQADLAAGETRRCPAESGIVVFEGTHRPETGSTHSMLATSDPDRIDIAFDDDRLVDRRGPAAPRHARSAGSASVNWRTAHLDLGDAPGRANAGDKLLTLVASALAGGECIDDAAALRAGGTASVLGCTVKAPSTLGDLPAQLQLGPRPPARPRQPRVARPQLGGRSGTGRGAVHDRPRFDDLRDLRPGEGGRPAPRLHGRARLSPAARRWGRDG